MKFAQRATRRWIRSAIPILTLLLSSCDSEHRDTTTGLVVFIGDSITEGWNLDKFVHGAVNVGIGGQETHEMAERFERDVLSRGPRAVVILGGINDINRWSTSDSASIMAMVQMSESAGIRVYVGNLLPVSGPPMNNYQAALPLIDMFNEGLAQGAASYGYDLVDYHGAMQLNGSQNTRLFDDGVHPNRAGYRVMWHTLREHLLADGLIAD